MIQQGDGVKYGFKSVEKVSEKNIVSEDRIRDIFEELNNTPRVDHGVIAPEAHECEPGSGQTNSEVNLADRNTHQAPIF